MYILYISSCSGPNGFTSGCRIIPIFKSSTLCRAVLIAQYASRIAVSTSSTSFLVGVSAIVEDDSEGSEFAASADRKCGA